MGMDLTRHAPTAAPKAPWAQVRRSGMHRGDTAVAAAAPPARAGVTATRGARSRVGRTASDAMSGLSDHLPAAATVGLAVVVLASGWAAAQPSDVADLARPSVAPGLAARTPAGSGELIDPVLRDSSVAVRARPVAPAPTPGSDAAAIVDLASIARLLPARGARPVQGPPSTPVATSGVAPGAPAATTTDDGAVVGPNGEAPLTDGTRTWFSAERFAPPA